METIKMCPLKFLKKDVFSEKFNCEQEKCAWWCAWANSCSMAVIPSKISD